MDNIITKEITISFHNGNQYSRDHNIRNKNVVEKEKHIDPDGYHVSWVDEKPQDAYKRLFDDAVNKYNEKQTRKDRKINNYYNSIKKSARKNAVYEVIVGIGNIKNQIDDKLKEEIMHQFLEDFKKMNPNLEVIGGYFHADEVGLNSHLHIDYIPVAHNYKTGPETQNGLAKAFSEMGYEISFENGRKITGQMKWEQAMRDHLEKLCVERGIVNIIHPLKGKGVKHLEKDEYIAREKIKAANLELEEVLKEVEEVKSYHDDIQNQLNLAKIELEKFKSEKKKNKKELDSLSKELEKLSHNKELLITEIEKKSKVLNETLSRLQYIIEESQKNKVNEMFEKIMTDNLFEDTKAYAKLLKRKSKFVDEKTKEYSKKTIDKITEEYTRDIKNL